MSEAQQRAFYGDDHPLVAAIEAFRKLTGSDACARELVEAADYVEGICAPTIAFSQMSKEVC